MFFIKFPKHVFKGADGADDAVICESHQRMLENK